RVIRLAHGDEAHAETGGSRHLLLGLGPAAHLQQQAPAAAGELRQGLEGRAGAAILVDQGTEGSGSHAFRADEAKPVETLLIRQDHGLSLLPDLALGPGQKAADVLAVLPP